ncbi:MAG: DUF349 domain-containing protein [Xanthomonadales bacterium]|nr:DUF349 domain-containing protein [Xanthomonadales bacterium]
MSLLDSFTAPKWQHKNPDVRQQAVADIDDEHILLSLISDDPDASVRSAALARITRPEVLDQLIADAAGPLLQQARRQRLAQMLPDTTRLATIDDEPTLQRIALLSDDPELIAAAIARIQGTEALMELAVTHPLAGARLAAAQTITDVESLDALLQRTRGHDKSVYRHCKAVLDEHLARERTTREREQEVDQLTHQCERLAAAPDSASCRAEHQQLRERWTVIAESATADQRSRFEQASGRCAERLAQMAQKQAEKEQLKNRQDAAEATFANIAAELVALDMSALMDSGTRSQLVGQLDSLQARWQEAEKAVSAPAEQRDTVRRQIAHWRQMIDSSEALQRHEAKRQNLLGKVARVDPKDYAAIQQHIERTEKLLEALAWPEARRAEVPDPVLELRKTLEQLQARARALEEKQPQLLDQLQAALESLRSELEQEQVKPAARSLNRARAALKSLPPARQQRFEREIKSLAARLHEFQDWQGFAIEPKKVELCGRMKALIGSSEDIDLLAGKIKELQAEWKALGALPHTREKELWNEFKAASDEAWQPCQAGFEERNQLQRQNFEQRMQLVAQLDAYEKSMAWPDAADRAEQDSAEPAPLPDWRLVQKTLDTARQAFREIKPVKPRAARKSQKALNSVCERIYSHIKAEYDRNIALKEQLVTEAKTLVDTDDLQQAIDRAKRLQADWKEIGITPMSVDRKLWKAFRGACDDVFKRLEDQRKQVNVQMKEQIKTAESLRDQARALLESGHPARSLSELKRAFEQIELPNAVRQGIGREFQALEKQARERARDARRHEELASWALLADKIQACALKPADRAEAERLWERDGGLPKGIDAESLLTYWMQGPQEQEEEGLRTACIALEVLGDIDSPNEDKQARMNYQLQRLAGGLGQHHSDPEPQIIANINAFIAMRAPLDWSTRFCSTIRILRAS